MMMSPPIRKLSLAAHVTFCVGWLGAVAAYLAPAIAGLTSDDGQKVSAAYLSMVLIIQFVVIPLSLAALVSGLIQSLATEWGLFRHYWITAKLILTVVGVAILLGHAPAVSKMSELIALSADFGMMRTQLVVHAAGGLLLLLATTTLSVYKPWGRTAYGRRKQNDPRPGSGGSD